MEMVPYISQMNNILEVPLKMTCRMEMGYINA